MRIYPRADRVLSLHNAQADPGRPSWLMKRYSQRPNSTAYTQAFVSSIGVISSFMVMVIDD